MMDWPAIVTIVGSICAVILGVGRMCATAFETIFKSQIDRLIADSAAHNDAAKIRADRNIDHLSKLEKAIKRLKKKKCQGQEGGGPARPRKPAS